MFLQLIRLGKIKPCLTERSDIDPCNDEINSYEIYIVNGIINTFSDRDKMLLIDLDGMCVDESAQADSVALLIYLLALI